jgi:hypothetical protein
VAVINLTRAFTSAYRPCYHPRDFLGDDVLLLIFQQLEGEDLVKCEAVCRQFIGYENRDFHTVHRIQTWKLGNPSTLLKTFTHKRLARVKLGERFLLLESHSSNFTMNFDFVSNENEESRNLILKFSGYAYARCFYCSPTGSFVCGILTLEHISVMCACHCRTKIN